MRLTATLNGSGAPMGRRNASGGLSSSSWGETHRGCVRAANEDAILVRPEAGLWAVADGMGGHDAGGLASEVVIDALSCLAPHGSAYRRGGQIEAAIHSANARIRTLSRESNFRRMGSTVALLYVHGNNYACMWAGDSRAYVLKRRTLRQITRDHSVLQEVVDAGLVNRDAAARMYGANAITRAVGIRDTLKLDCAYGVLEDGDRMLLCSDGVTAVLADAEIERLLDQPDASVNEIVSDITSACIAAGAPDNVSVIVIAVAGE